jgi:hypothetical protein
MIKEIPAGAIGVCVMDTREKPRLFKLLPWPHHMGVAYFEPLDNPGAVVPFPIRDFWALIDKLP